jgi:Zn-finger nucleic acid-binding protein
MAARIDALLGLANVSHAAFEAQAERLDKIAAGREHVEPASVTASAFAAAPPRKAAPAPVGSRAGAWVTRGTCPSCGSPLRVAEYEGVPVDLCSRCGGRWVAAAAVTRIMARRGAAFSDEQQRLAEGLAARGDQLRRAAVRARFTPVGGLRACPGCGAPMIRRLYSYDDAVEVDYCSPCDSFWFDKDELEVLQLIAERRLG